MGLEDLDYRVLMADNGSVYDTHTMSSYDAKITKGGFTTMAVINQPERKLAKRTSVHCLPSLLSFLLYFTILRSCI